jgi:hypothetical protein
MKRLQLFLAVLAASALLGYAPQAHAQATRTWVSGVGDDVNPCSRTAPCKTFAGAISKTATGGEINCLDPGGFGALTITKSMTIDCSGTFGSVLHSGTNGFNIAFDSFAATDTHRAVKIRGVSFNGTTTGLTGIRVTGTTGAAGSYVSIESCVLDGNFGGAGRGISDERSGGGKLFVLNTTVRNMSGAGIIVAPGSPAVLATLERVEVSNTGGGISIGGVAQISRSVLFGNGVGVQPVAGSFVSINDTQINLNTTGIANAGNTRISNSDVTFNSLATTGTITTYGNNRFFGNAGAAPTLSPAGGAAAALGQQ